MDWNLLAQKSLFCTKFSLFVDHGTIMSFTSKSLT
jgi:hypothetical protein